MLNFPRKEILIVFCSGPSTILYGAIIECSGLGVITMRQSGQWMVNAPADLLHHFNNHIVWGADTTRA